MKVFRELELYGSQSDLIEGIKAIEKRLDAGWVRNTEREEKISTVASGTNYCFTCSKDGDREAASLWFSYQDDTTLYVSNIVPEEIRELSYDQYNLIIEEFYEQFVKPMTDQLGLEHLLTADAKQIEDWISKETAEKLRHFSKAANKSTGSSHPLDQQRWLVFLVSAHKENAQLDTHTLMRWLIETEGWFEEAASELGIEYEFARSLLKFYDEQ